MVSHDSISDMLSHVYICCIACIVYVALTSSSSIHNFFFRFRLEYDFHNRCGGSRRDQLANHAALLVIQRSDDYIMVPGYDLYNHRNGRHHNTEIRWEHEQPHVTKASRKIKKGEEIFNSYNFCAECEGRVAHYGAAGMHCWCC